MANNWAIAIGINQYQYFQSLVCAQADAQAVRDFLVTKGRFSPQQCVVMSDTSPPIGDRSTQPTRENILLLIEDLAAACWRPGDRVWFFFSGYGVNDKGKDYLMPVDGNYKRVEDTGIEVAALMQCLQAARVQALFLLDVNRAMGTYPDAFVGQETIELAQNMQLSTILSCQPEQFSYETTELGHGFFTAALLEALRSGNANTLGELEAYLSVRTPELCQHYWRPTQNPVTVMAYTKQKILGEINLDSDLDAAAIVLPEELFSAVVAAPRLEPTPKPNYPIHQPAAAVTSPPNWGYTNLESTQNSDPNFHQETEHQASLPPSLPPARSSQINNSSALAKATQQRQPLSTLWVHVLIWSISAALCMGLILFLFARNRDRDRHANEPISTARPLSQTIPNFQPVPKLSSVPAKPFTNPSTNSSTSTAETPSPSPKTVHLSPSDILTTPLPVDGEETETTPTKSFTTPVASPSVSVSPSVSASPSVSVSPSVSASPTPTKPPIKATSPVPKSQPSDREIARIELAKLGLQPSLPRHLNAAVTIASRLKPEHPNYAKAQANMQVWNQMLLEIAINRAKKRQYSNAIAAAQLITKNEPMYTDAQNSINQWQSDAKRYFGNKTVIDAAQKLIKPSYASTYNRAIEVAKRVPSDEPGADIAENAINKWSNQILKLAQQRAATGDLKAAIETATLVPEDTPARDKAQKSIQTWKARQRKSSQ